MGAQLAWSERLMWQWSGGSGVVAAAVVTLAESSGTREREEERERESVGDGRVMGIGAGWDIRGVESNIDMRPHLFRQTLNNVRGAHLNPLLLLETKMELKLKKSLSNEF